jgi:hypothetical protein
VAHWATLNKRSREEMSPLYKFMMGRDFVSPNPGRGLYRFVHRIGRWYDPCTNPISVLLRYPDLDGKWQYALASLVLRLAGNVAERYLNVLRAGHREMASYWKFVSKKVVTPRKVQESGSLEYGPAAPFEIPPPQGT